MTVGGLFQLAGVALIFWEISGIQRTLRLPPWWRSTISDLGGLLSSIPGRFRRRRITGTGSIVMHGVATATGSLSVVLQPAEGATVEERLESHRGQLAALREELERVQQLLDQDRAEGRAAVTNVETRLRGEIASVRQLLSNLSGGFLRGRALGGGLILIGTALITIGVWV
jgi:hypothetical protein